MKYEQALKVWGAQRIEAAYAGGVVIDPADVHVEFDFNEGYACCGGRDPDCYCSYAESPSANIRIQAGHRYTTIDHYEFDFAAILKEIVEAADGAITRS